MPSLRPVRNDIETIKLLMPLPPSPPTCRACGKMPAISRCEEDGGSEPLCDRCWQKMVPAGVDEFLQNLPRDKNGNRVACGGVKP